MENRMLSRRELANAIRALSMDAVQRANIGHPGAPMGMADMAEVLWNDFLKHNPANPKWVDRDRFVMSNGHGSMLMFDNYIPKPPVIQSSDIPRVSKLRRVRWDRALPMPSVWPWLSAHLPSNLTGATSTLLII
jgi:transketolase N-terminal domain/subunit